VIVGYSYGSVIGSSVVDDHESIIGYAAISYPFGPLKLMLLSSLLPRSKSTKPKLFIMGSNDNFTSTKKFLDHMKSFPDPKEYHIVEEEDHFWVRSEEKILHYLLPWIEKIYQTTSSSTTTLHSVVTNNTNNTNSCTVCSHENKL
jgi:alpha/beta superfamily hydrolase